MAHQQICARLRNIIPQFLHEMWDCSKSSYFNTFDPEIVFLMTQITAFTVDGLQLPLQANEDTSSNNGTCLLSGLYSVSILIAIVFTQ